MNTDPNEILAKEIFDALSENGLINPNESKSILEKIASGDINDSDWKLAFESAIRNPLNTTNNEIEIVGN